MTPLADEVVDRELVSLPGWTRTGSELRCSYRLPSFLVAVALTQQVAAIAEELAHHPEWTVRYRLVDFVTTTHDADGLTDLDLQLARRIGEAAATVQAEPMS